MSHLEGVSVGNLTATRRLWDGVSADVMSRSLTTSGLWKSCLSVHDLGRTSLALHQLELTLVVGAQVKRPQELERESWPRGHERRASSASLLYHSILMAKAQASQPHDCDSGRVGLAFHRPQHLGACVLPE